MSDRFEKMSFFEQLQAGLEDSIAFSRGRISLKTTDLPAPPPTVNRQTVVNIRKQLRMSQAVFAATLNVSHKTVQSWEQGTRAPSHAALRFLQVIKEQPHVVSAIFDAAKSRNVADIIGSKSRGTANGRNGRHAALIGARKKKRRVRP